MTKKEREMDIYIYIHDYCKLHMSMCIQSLFARGAAKQSRMVDMTILQFCFGGCLLGGPYRI